MGAGRRSNESQQPVNNVAVFHDCVSHARDLPDLQSRLSVTKTMPRLIRRISLGLALAATLGFAGAPGAVAASQKTLRVLFIGNSFTNRHSLAQVVKAMAEAGDPNLHFEVASVIYAGRNLRDHWRLGTQNYVAISTLTPAAEQATITGLEETLAKDPKDNFARSALGRHREWLKTLAAPRKAWDVVVLQSYKDDLQGERSPYMEYATKFAALIKGQGARVVLYETTPDTQNGRPLTAPPSAAPVIAKARSISALAKRIDAIVVPMSTIALQVQTARPDLTLRFVDDAHPNQTMAYLTACTFYGALFNRSPEGLSVDSVTETRYLDHAHKDQDRDGGPLRRIFSARERADLQRLAWEGLKEFQRRGESP